jgi:hypothetical protein
MRLVDAKIVEGGYKMGFTSYYIVDQDNNLLNTEPICLVPDTYHEWFKEHLKNMNFEYWGVKESP